MVKAIDFVSAIPRGVAGFVAGNGSNVVNYTGEKPPNLAQSV